jgi:hypothetical protein
MEQTFTDLEREDKLKNIQGWISELRGYDFGHVLRVSCPLVNIRNPTFQSLSNGALIYFNKDQYLTRLPPRAKPDLN